MNSFQDKVLSAKSLNCLLDCLNGYDEEQEGLSLNDAVDLSSLPTFGENPIEDTSEVYSWDDEHIMVFNNRWELEKRCLVCGEAPFHCDHE